MGTRLRALLKGIRSAFNHLVFLPYCLLGEHFLANGEHLVCTDCLSDLKKTPAPHRPFGQSYTGTHLQDVASYWEFSEDFRLLIHQLKYHQKPRVGILLGRYVAEVLTDHWDILDGWLVPIPLHNSKLRERGYNQSVYIAQGIAEVFQLPVKPDVLVRKIYTRTQTHLSRKERKANMHNAFVVAESYREHISEHSMILVDDVFTTGATLESAARCLLQSGSLAVYGLTLGTVPLR